MARAPNLRSVVPQVHVSAAHMEAMLDSQREDYPLDPWDASHHGSSFGHDAMASNQQAMPRPGSSQNAASAPGLPGRGISKQAATGDSHLSLGGDSEATLVGNQGLAEEQQGRSSVLVQKETSVPSKVKLLDLGLDS